MTNFLKKEVKELGIHEDAKEIAEHAGISHKEYQKLHPGTKEELLSNMKKDKYSVEKTGPSGTENYALTKPNGDTHHTTFSSKELAEKEAGKLNKNKKVNKYGGELSKDGLHPKIDKEYRDLMRMGKKDLIDIYSRYNKIHSMSRNEDKDIIVSEILRDRHGRDLTVHPSDKYLKKDSPKDLSKEEHKQLADHHTQEAEKISNSDEYDRHQTKGGNKFHELEKKRLEHTSKAQFHHSSYLSAK